MSHPVYTEDRRGYRVMDREFAEWYRNRTSELTDELISIVPPGALRDQAFKEVRDIANDPENAYDLHDAFLIIINRKRRYVEGS